MTYKKNFQNILQCLMLAEKNNWSAPKLIRSIQIVTSENDRKTKTSITRSTINKTDAQIQKEFQDTYQSIEVFQVVLRCMQLSKKNKWTAADLSRAIQLILPEKTKTSWLAATQLEKSDKRIDSKIKKDLQKLNLRIDNSFKTPERAMQTLLDPETYTKHGKM
jgi:hypothetical protein